MKTIQVVAALAASTLPLMAQAQQAHTSLDSTINRLGRDLVRKEEAIGLSIGVYANGHDHFYNFGTTLRGEARPPTEHTVYEIGSITKTFVSLVLANAALEGRLDLHDDVRQHLKGSYPNLEYDGKPIRLVHLANTTSALPDWLPELPAEKKGLPPDAGRRARIDYYKDLTRMDFRQALHMVTLDTAPGTRTRHSNAGTQLLAWILEDVYQAPMEALVQRYVTGPNGMKSTFFIGPGEMRDVARGYTASGEEAPYEFVVPYFRNAGGMGSSASDLVKYVELLLDHSKAAAQLCLKKTVDVDVSSAAVVPMAPDEKPSPAVYSVALSWLEYQPSASELQIWADGGTNGFNSYVVVYPLLNSGVVLLANKSDEKIFKALPSLAAEISRALGPR